MQDQNTGLQSARPLQRMFGPVGGGVKTAVRKDALVVGDSHPVMSRASGPPGARRSADGTDESSAGPGEDCAAKPSTGLACAYSGAASLWAHDGNLANQVWVGEGPGELSH